MFRIASLVSIKNDDNMPTIRVWSSTYTRVIFLRLWTWSLVMPYILRLCQENKLSLQLRNYSFPIHAVIGITNNGFFFWLIFISIHYFYKILNYCLYLEYAFLRTNSILNYVRRNRMYFEAKLVSKKTFSQ